MSVIDRVKSHFETLKTITIEVEEWKTSMEMLVYLFRAINP